MPRQNQAFVSVDVPRFRRYESHKSGIRSLTLRVEYGPKSGIRSLALRVEYGPKSGIRSLTSLRVEYLVLIAACRSKPTVNFNLDSTPALQSVLYECGVEQPGSSRGS